MLGARAPWASWSRRAYEYVTTFIPDLYFVHSNLSHYYSNKCPKYFGKRPHRIILHWHRSNTRFLEPTEVSPPNGILIGSVVFAGQPFYLNVQNPTLYCFSVGRTGPKLPRLLGYLDSSRTWPTDRHTQSDHATSSVAIVRILFTECMQCGLTLLLLFALLSIIRPTVRVSVLTQLQSGRQT